MLTDSKHIAITTYIKRNATNNFYCKQNIRLTSLSPPDLRGGGTFANIGPGRTFANKWLIMQFPSINRTKNT